MNVFEIMKFIIEGEKTKKPYDLKTVVFFFFLDKYNHSEQILRFIVNLLKSHFLLWLHVYRSKKPKYFITLHFAVFIQPVVMVVDWLMEWFRWMFFESFIGWITIMSLCSFVNNTKDRTIIMNWFASLTTSSSSRNTFSFNQIYLGQIHIKWSIASLKQKVKRIFFISIKCEVVKEEDGR